MIITSIIKIGILATFAFIIANISTPILTHFLYKYIGGKQIRNNGDTPIFSKLHEKKRGTPTMGGILIWGTVLITIFLFALLGDVIKIPFVQHLNFFTRSETFLPFGAMIFAAVIGLVDDIWGIKGKGGNNDGIRFRHKILLYIFIGLVGALWFFFKLDWDVINVPLVGTFQIGWWYIPIFTAIITMTGVSVNETDGLDGLAGGVLMCAFSAFGVIAFMQGRFDLAAFCAVITGALLSFLWFNIPPARFYMGDTGAMSLGVTLGVIAMLTNSVFLLPIIGFVLILESLSVVIQLFSRKVFNGKKVFKSAPIHHHFEAKGWSECKIVMRFWVISAIFSGIGIIIALLDIQL